jgi:hypothetical protein
MTTNLSRTILNAAWVTANAEALRECLPEDWRPLRELNAFVIGERLRLLGIGWQGERELSGVLAALEYVGIMHIAIGRVPFDDKDVDIVKRGALDLGKLVERQR